MKNDLTKLENRIRVNYGLGEQCKDHQPESANCRTADAPEVMLWGDSYAMHLVQGLLASTPNIALVQATRSVCGPVLGAAPVNTEYPTAWARECLRSNERVIRYLKNTPSIKYAVLASPFFRYVNGGDELLLADGRLVGSGDAGVIALRETLATLRSLGITPVLVSPPPKNDTDIGRCLINASRFGAAPARCNFRAADINALTTQVYRALRSLESQAKVIWLQDAICRSQTCQAVIDETFIYRDGGHLSHEGSALLGKRMGWYEAITGSPPAVAVTRAATVRHGTASRAP